MMSELIDAFAASEPRRDDPPNDAETLLAARLIQTGTLAYRGYHWLCGRDGRVRLENQARVRDATRVPVPEGLMPTPPRDPRFAGLWG